MKEQGGFTLLEAVLALFLFLLVVQVVMAVFWHTLFMAEHLRYNLDLQYAIRRVGQHLGPDLANGEQVVIRDVAGQIAFRGTHLYITGNNETIHYYLLNRQIYRDSNRGSPQPLTESIAGLCFSTRNPGMVSLLVEAEQGSVRCEVLSAFGFNRYRNEVIQGR